MEEEEEGTTGESEGRSTGPGKGGWPVSSDGRAVAPARERRSLEEAQAGRGIVGVPSSQLGVRGDVVICKK